MKMGFTPSRTAKSAKNLSKDKARGGPLSCMLAHLRDYVTSAKMAGITFLKQKKMVRGMSLAPLLAQAGAGIGRIIFLMQIARRAGGLDTHGRASGTVVIDLIVSLV